MSGGPDLHSATSVPPQRASDESLVARALVLHSPRTGAVALALVGVCLLVMAATGVSTAAALSRTGSQSTAQVLEVLHRPTTQYRIRFRTDEQKVVDTYTLHADGGARVGDPLPIVYDVHDAARAAHGIGNYYAQSLALGAAGLVVLGLAAWGLRPEWARPATSQVALHPPA